MALLSPIQRWLAPLVIAGLMVPSVGMLFSAVQSKSAAENRMLAAPPTWPRDLAGWRTLPRQVDAYLGDHFAFRQVLTTASNQLHWRLGSQRGDVVRGKDDRLFLRDNLLNVTGGVVDAHVVDDYGRFVCDMGSRLKARAIPMVFSMAPSPAVLYPEALPDWVPRGRPSAYDLLLARARACGVMAVDLRPPLLAAKASGSIYFHQDTHWTPKGALIAYNALTDGLKRPNWRIPLDQLVWRRVREDDHDLARMGGASSLTPDLMDTPDLASRTDKLTLKLMNGVSDYGARLGFIDETGHPGPTVLFIGDSYSADFMPPYFANAVGRFAWIHQQWCGFDWRIFDVVKPDYVIVMPVDRAASCSKGQRPRNMPNPK
ncbi:MAG: alginate O-acetyltransferase AlgX-related protein [Caulobacteraceae bacterium]